MKRTVVVVAVFVVVSVVVSVVPAGVAAGGNEAPLADAGLDQEAEVGETVLLDATGSRDPDGHVGSYEWHIQTPGGTTVRPADPTDPRTRFVVREQGRYEVTVTVTDDDGATTTDTLYVDVTGSSESESSSSSSDVSVISTRGSAGGTALAGPVDSALDLVPWIDVSGPGTVTVGETATFGARVGGFESAPTVTWTGGDSGRTATVQFGAPGSYRLTAYASDGERIVSDAASVWVLRNEPPTVDIRTPENVEPGEAVRLSAKASDPDGRIVDETWSPNRTITVPDEGDRKTVTVTVYDDDRSAARDTIAITGGEHTMNDAPTQVRCAPTRKPITTYVCEINGERQEYSTGEWADKAEEWQKSDEYEFDEVSSDNMTWNSDLITEKPEDDLTSYDTLRFLADNSILTEDNSISERYSKEQGYAKKTMEPYKQNGKRVAADLTGDGKIDAVDWERRYGEPKQNTLSVRDDARIIKQHQRAQEAALTEQGKTVNQDDSQSTGREFSDSHGSLNTDGSSPTDRTGSDSPAGVRFT